MAVLGHCVRQSDDRASMTAKPFLAFGSLIGIELEGIPGRDCSCEKHRVVKEQLSGFVIEVLCESKATLQQRDRGSFIISFPPVVPQGRFPRGGCEPFRFGPQRLPPSLQIRIERR